MRSTAVTTRVVCGMILEFGGATRLLFAVAILAAILFPASAPAPGKTPPAAPALPTLKVVRTFVIQPDFIEQGITRAANGDLLIPAAERRPPVPSDIRLVRSTDGGNTWTHREPVSTGLRESWAYGKIVQLPDGRVLVVFYSHLHHGDERAYRTRTIANVLEEVPAQ